MKKLLLIAAAVVVCAVTVPAFRHVLAQSTDFFWGIGGNSSMLNANQGGSIELGGADNAPNQNGAQPFIDMHYGNGQVQDFNVRIANSGDGQLAFITQPANQSSQTMAVIDHSGVAFYGGISNQGSAIKHVSTNTGCSTGTGTVCQVSISWPGQPFSDTNYAVVCNPKGIGAPSTSPVTWGVFVPDNQRFADHVVVSLTNLGSFNNTSAGGFTCIAVHD